MSYFPPVSSRALKLEKFIRNRVFNYIPLSLSSLVYRHLIGFFNNRSFIKTSSVRNNVLHTTDNESIYFPYEVSLKVLLMLSYGYKKWLYRKYTMPGFVEVSDNDVVVDCGAFVGGFSLSAVHKAKTIYCFEPSYINYSSASRNLEKYKNVVLYNAGLFTSTERLAFNISDNPVDSSILSPDDGIVKEKVSIQVYNPKDLFSQLAVEKIDFFKLEAEGVELEILEATEGLDIHKFAIDCSPERDGMSPLEEVVSILKSRDYKTVQRGYMIFAKKRKYCE